MTSTVPMQRHRNLDEKQWRKALLGPPGCPQSLLLRPWSHRSLPEASFLEEAPLPSCSQPLEGQGCRPLSSSRSSLGSVEARMAGDPSLGAPTPLSSGPHPVGGRGRWLCGPFR